MGIFSKLNMNTRTIVFLSLGIGALIYLTILHQRKCNIYQIKHWFAFPYSTPAGVDHICKDIKKGGIILTIYSPPENKDARDAIRNSFASDKILEKLNMRRVFLIAQAGGFRKSHNINAEIEQHRDIILGEFDETKLCHKGLMGLRFVNDFCPQARWLVHIHDYTMTNVYALVQALDHKLHFTIYGKVSTREAIVVCSDATKASSARCINADSRYVNRDHYPRYANGLGYVMTTDLIPVILRESKLRLPFKYDDVYITGTLTENIIILSMVNWSDRMNEVKNKIKPDRQVFQRSDWNTFKEQWNKVVKPKDVGLPK